jgi:hypothetical protein
MATTIMNKNVSDKGTASPSQLIDAKIASLGDWRGEMLARLNRHRRRWLLGSLMANRYAAAEVRAYQMRGFLLEQYRRIMRTETTADLRLVRHQTGTRLVGAVFGGVATTGERGWV